MRTIFDVGDPRYDYDYEGEDAGNEQVEIDHAEMQRELSIERDNEKW